MVHEVGPPDAEVENVDLLQDGVVEGIKEPGSVGNLLGQNTPVTHHMVVQSISPHGAETQGAIINTHAESHIPHFRNTSTGGGNYENLKGHCVMF